MPGAWERRRLAGGRSRAGAEAFLRVGRRRGCQAFPWGRKTQNRTRGAPAGGVTTRGAAEKMKPSTSLRSPGEPLKRMGADLDVFVVGRRVVACLFDCSLVALVSSVTFSPLLFVRPSLVLVLVLLLLFLLVFCAVFLVHAAVLDGYKGQTLGKELLGVEVIREQSGAPPGPYRAALRALTFLFVDMLVGLFVMLASHRRQRPGDVAVGTLVVRKKGR